MTTLEEDVRAACWAVKAFAKDLYGYRQHDGAQKFLTDPECMKNMEDARDYISRVFDKARGVK